MFKFNFYSLLMSLLAATVLATSACSSSTKNKQHLYPLTKRIEVINNYHGQRIADPYQWMETGNSAELADWLSQQQALTDSYLNGPAWTATSKRITELENYTINTSPIKAGGKYFFSQHPSIATHQTSVYVGNNPSADPRLLLASPYHYQESIDQSLIRFGGYLPSHSGRTVAYTSSSDGSRWHQMRFIDTQSGMLLDDQLDGLNPASGTASWAPDQEQLYYTSFDEPAAADKFSAPVNNGRVLMHTVGLPAASDVIIFEPANSDLIPSAVASLDGHYVIIHVFNPGNQTNQIFLKDAHTEQPAIELFSNSNAQFTYLDNDAGQFWFYTNDQAPNGQIIKLDIHAGMQTVVVAERNEPMSGGSFVGGNAIGKFGHQFVILYMQDAVPLIRIFDLQGHLKKELNTPTGGSLWGGFTGRADDPELYFGFLGMFDPATIYRMDARSGVYELLNRSKPKGLDANQFETRLVYYDSFDGTRVPMFIAHKKGLIPDASSPAFVYGYGAFGWNSFLFYQSHLIAWMEMGGIYAQPGLRGGGEYGQAWHAAGKGANKENTIKDFIAAAEWLIDNDYTRASKLVANGGSASAMPAAIAVLRRPELFSAAIYDRPALDMLRFNQFTNGRLWLDEFGTPDTVEGFHALQRMSPYHNLTPDTCYSPTMIMVGEVDPVTIPMHGYKFTASLQHLQSCGNPVLLYSMPKTAHSFGSTPEQIIKSRTAMIVFLQKSLNLRIIH